SISQDNSINISGPYDGPSFIVKTEGLNWRHSSCINMYNRNFIVSNNLFFNNNIYYSEDCIFVWNVFIKAQKVYCINSIFYNYVINANSCMNNKSQEHLINLTNSTFPLIKEFKSLQNLGNTIINKYIDRNINFLVVWHIHKLIQANKSLSTISDDIKVFKAMGLYPIADFTKFPGYNSKIVKLYRIIFNNKLTLYSLYYYYKLIKIFKH
ncbi:MAG: hypothetical protein IJN66_09505, partial [Muribaculaceae bacterium]|nr:hypothetical protein [Muribaculaceae bacterium]